MKIRMLGTIWGQFHGRNGVKRGDIVEDLPDFDCKRYIAGQLATAELKGELPTPYVETEESKAASREIAPKLRDMVPEEARPLPERAVGRHPAFPRGAGEGWSV
ncbi:hypothetical protein B8W69_06585 [Mycobacterium vulneris]|uniref:Uncharacterized protein n=1 Tax=Mycolicibacterium vulneris TaxID=547163 RepID=A0A1X2L9L8_9MYCO|nr:hypothetical protein [Mycolicibacterium vulneris]OSC30698.1 hypothetical protein B8W69_06585 [Mycolicibacterium vulneris]